MAGDSFLGINKSASGARWVNALSNLPTPQRNRLAAALCESFPDLPLPVAAILADRGLDAASLSSYMQPKLRDLLPNPSRFKDLDKAVERLSKLVVEGGVLGIFGDYDVDGAAAAALLVMVMRQLGVDCEVHIPDRFSEGYGPNAAALQALQAKGANLVATVDCGITAHAPLAAAADAGIDVIVVDHHIAGPELPRAHAVVNPNRLDEDGAYGHLCATGVVFILLVGLVRRLRETGQLGLNRRAPDLISHLDVVALATVCDVVPLVGLNRAFVVQGLKVMAGRGHIGLAALADVAGLSEAPSTHSLGFLLGPRINAGGRIGNSELGVKLLAATVPDEAIGLAARLDELNYERRQIDEKIRLEAIDRAYDDQNPVLILHDKAWHEGVIGIVAGRVRERFGKPALIIAMGADGVGKGSGRSIPGFRLGNAIIAAHQAGILAGGGGHDMAAGFTVKASKLADLQVFLNDRLSADLNGSIPQIIHKSSGLLSIAGCQLELLDWLDGIGPFGSGNPEPRFVLADCLVKAPRPVGAEGAHLSCRLDDGSGILNAIAFQSGGSPLGHALIKAGDGHRLHVLGRLRRDRFRGGRAMQFEIDDAAVALQRF